MNRFYSFLLLILTFCLQSVKAGSVPDGMPIEIYASFVEPYPAKGPIMRVPANVPEVYLKDDLVTFDAFGSACTLELVDTETNETIYTQVIPAGDTSCLFPSTLQGRYLIRFVFESVVYWGYIDLI